MASHFEKGDIVLYHPVIGGPSDGKEYEIVDFGSMNADRDICWLLGKRGCVSTRAISLACLPEHRGNEMSAGVFCARIGDRYLGRGGPKSPKRVARKIRRIHRRQLARGEIK